MSVLDKPQASRRWPYVIPLVMFGMLALVFALQLFSGDPSKVPSALIGRAAPAFDLPPLPSLTRNGEPVPGLSTADLVQGRLTLVNVWASWCGPCRDEHPVLMLLAKNPKIRLVGINYKDRPDNARRFLSALGNPFERVGVDSTGRAAIDWGVYGVPETFIVGPDGTVLHKHVGPLTPQHLERGVFADVLKRF